MATIGDATIEHVRRTVTEAGAEFVAVRSGCVIFTDPKTGKTCSLYAFACDSANVRLALKSLREPEPADFEPLQRTSP